jgi:carboxymethylenebutenolidase
MTGVGEGKPCVVVLHEIWGPDSHLEGACKRLRKLGFTTAVPNLYRGYESLLTPVNVQKAMEAVWNLSLEERRDKKKLSDELAKKQVGAKVEEALSVLYDQNFRDGMMEMTMGAVRDAREHGRVATLGFSLGGGLSLASATRPGHPDSAVAYCGEPPESAQLEGVSVPMLAICASHDELMGPKMPAFLKAAQIHGNDLTVKTLPGTEHDFFNETKKDRYNKAAAEEAWKVTADFLSKTLRGGAAGRAHSKG